MVSHLIVRQAAKMLKVNRDDPHSVWRTLGIFLAHFLVDALHSVRSLGAGAYVYPVTIFEDLHCVFHKNCRTGSSSQARSCLTFGFGAFTGLAHDSGRIPGLAAVEGL